jgi:hypothetical protein
VGAAGYALKVDRPLAERSSTKIAKMVQRHRHDGQRAHSVRSYTRTVGSSSSSIDSATAAAQQPSAHALMVR